MSKARSDRQKNHAKMMKEMGIARRTFQSFCGHTIAIGQASILQHFAVCKGKGR